MIQWSTLPMWQIQRNGLVYTVKINHTTVETRVRDICHDSKVKIEIYGTDNRVIGYSITPKKLGTKPLSLLRPSYLGLFYSAVKNLSDLNCSKDISILYHDANLRLLAFGKDKIKDYLVVMRKM